MKASLVLAVALAFSGCATAPKPAEFGLTRKAELEAFMWDYLKLWNAHDAATISARVYRLEGNNPWGTQAGLQAEFDRLKAQGYDKTDTKSVTGCILSPDTGQVELRYIRLKTDGSFMPPKDRASIYRLRKFPDGWRVTGMSGLAADKKMDCPVISVY
jgi:hypothetical protein